MSQDEIAALVDRFAAAPKRIERAVARVDAARLTTLPAAGEWSARDVLAHLRASDDILAPRLVAILVRDRPPLPAYDERRWAEVLDYAGRDFHDLLRVYAGRRAELVDTLRRLAPEDWQREGTHEERGPRAILQLLRILVEHEQEHCAQIEVLLA
jgi:uncharacterized damage-inducible protein DinB